MDPTSNMVTWFQIPADKPERASTFYRQVFGWEPDDTTQPPPGAVRGEIAARTDDLTTPRLVIRVADVDQTLEQVTDAGGRMRQKRTAIPEIGMAFAVFEDTEGNILNVVGDMP